MGGGGRVVGGGGPPRGVDRVTRDWWFRQGNPACLATAPAGLGEDVGRERRVGARALWPGIVSGYGLRVCGLRPVNMRPVAHGSQILAGIYSRIDRQVISIVRVAVERQRFGRYALPPAPDS